MPSEPMNIADQSIAITDPGQVDAHEHMWGDRLMVHVGNVTAWLFPLLVVAIVTQVIIRKMGFNQAWLDDAQWWLYGFAMLVGFGYAITTNSHVRVDIFHQNYEPKKQNRIEVFALGWLLLPFLILMTDILFHYAVSSIVAREGSDSPNGLHMLYLLKTSLPILFAIAIIAAVSIMRRFLRKLGQDNLFGFTLGALPAISFLIERLYHYVTFWIVKLNNPDIRDSKIDDEPLVAASTHVAVGLTLALLAYAWFRRRGTNAGSEAA